MEYTESCQTNPYISLYALYGKIIFYGFTEALQLEM